MGQVETKRVVILGGGFAGLTVAMDLIFSKDLIQFLDVLAPMISHPKIPSPLQSETVAVTGDANSAGIPSRLSASGNNRH